MSISENSAVTSPPILDATGQEIVNAIRSLRYTDSTLSIQGKPADALIVGQHINNIEDKIAFSLITLDAPNEKIIINTAI